MREKKDLTMKRELITRSAAVMLPLSENDKIKLLEGQEQRLYSLLYSGGQWSVIEIMKKLLITDPRKVISRIRKKGIAISDMWCVGVYGARYKRYFIHK